MKKIILIAFLLLCFFQNGWSQNEPRLIKIISSRNFPQESGFQKHREEIYSYDLSGNLSSSISTNYDSNEEVEIIRGLFFEYNAENLLQKKLSRRYNSDVNLWITSYWITYEYDANRCLTSETLSRNIGSLISSRTTYTRNSDCQIISEHKENSSSPGILSSSHYFEREYFSDGISYEERIFYNASFADSTLSSRIKIQTFNKNEFLINSHVKYLLPSSLLLFEKKYTYEYDDFDNIIKEQRFQKDQDSLNWELLEDVNYYNDYDENGFLIKTKTEEIGYGIGQLILSPHLNMIFDYKNSCEGIVEERLFHLQESDLFRKNEYIYEGVNECFDIEEKDLKILIYPNPSLGFIEISSPIFQTGNTEISVYSIDGKVLLQKIEKNRSTSSSLDLSFLPNGFYVLHLRNGDHFVKEKIVIFK